MNSEHFPLNKGVGLMFLALAGFGLSLLIPLPAHAVVGNVSLTSMGNPVAGATISFQTSNGQVVAEGKTDDDGKAAVAIPEQYRGSTLTAVAEKDGRKSRQQVDVDRDDLKIAMFLPPTVGSLDRFRFSLALFGLYKWRSYDGGNNYLSGMRSMGGGFHFGDGGFGAEVQIRPPSRYLGGHPFFFSLAYGYPSVEETFAYVRYHFGSTEDTYTTLKEDYYLRLLLGYQILALQQLQVSVLGGAQFTSVEAGLNTNESSGGGTSNRFSETKLMASPVLGLGFAYPLFNNIRAYLIGSFYLTWMDDIGGSGTSTLGNTYSYNVSGGVQPEAQMGVRLDF